MPEVCTRCGRKATGYAFINQARYCHDDERSCYEQAQHDGVSVTPLIITDMSTTENKEQS